MKKKKITIQGKETVKYYKTDKELNDYIKYLKQKYDDKDLAGEIWKNVDNFSRYEFSNYGRIRALNYKNSPFLKILTPHITGGYLQTMLLNNNGKYQTKKIHWLISYAFLGKRSDGVKVNHIDGNKLNNKIVNLEYITHSQNCKHSFDIGLQKPKRGELNGMSKLTQKQVDGIRRRKKEGGRYWGRNKIAEKLNISPKHIQKIANNTESW